MAISDFDIARNEPYQRALAGVSPYTQRQQENFQMGPLDALRLAAMSTMAVPVLGDVTGLAADAYGYATDPSQRNALNYGMTLAGLLPLVPSASSLSPVKGAVKKIESAFPEVKLNVYGSPRAGYTIGEIVVPKNMQNQGIGTQIMETLTQAADAEKAKLALTPSADFGGTVPRLEKFYKRFGFQPNAGKRKDFSISEKFIRIPAEQP